MQIDIDMFAKGNTQFFIDEFSAEESLVLMRSNKLNARSMIAYVTELNHELEIGHRVQAMLSQESVEESLSTHPEPMIGQLIYMVQRLVPGSQFANTEDSPAVLPAPAEVTTD